VDALAFATLGFASDGSGGVSGTTAVILADVEIEGPVDVAVLDLMLDATLVDDSSPQVIEPEIVPEVAAPDAAEAEPDVEIDTWP
jgi:hypothetical protein